MSKEFLSLEEDDRLIPGCDDVPVLEEEGSPETLTLEIPPDMLEVDAGDSTDFDFLSRGFLHNDPFLSYREESSPGGSLDSPLDSLSSATTEEELLSGSSEDLSLLQPSVWAEEDGLALPAPRPETSSLATLLQSNLLPAAPRARLIHRLLPDLYHNYSLDRQTATPTAKRASCPPHHMISAKKPRMEPRHNPHINGSSSSVLLNLLLKGEDPSHGYQCHGGGKSSS